MVDEFIRKQDAVDMCGGYGCLAHLMSTIKPADVVQVVRCKDCKFYTSMRPDIKTGICDLNVHHMGDDGFCSCGERKNDVPTNIIESLKEEINTVNRLNDRIKNRGNNG